MALATIEDLSAIGAQVTDLPRVLRLLEIASAEVVLYLGTTAEAISDVESDWTDEQRTVLAAIVAEVAATRIQIPAHPTTDPYGADIGAGAFASVLLAPRHKRALDMLRRARGENATGLFTIGVTRSDPMLDYTELLIPRSSAPDLAGT